MWKHLRVENLTEEVRINYRLWEEHADTVNLHPSQDCDCDSCIDHDSKCEGTRRIALECDSPDCELHPESCACEDCFEDYTQAEFEKRNTFTSETRCRAYEPAEFRECQEMDGRCITHDENLTPILPHRKEGE